LLIYGIIPVDDSVEEYFQPNLPSELPLTFEKQTLPFWNTSPSFVSDSFTTLQNVTSTPPTRPSGLPPRPSQDIWPTHYNLQQRANFIRFNLSHPELQQQKRREQQRQQQQHQQQLHQQLYWKPRPEVTFLPIQNNPFQLATPPPLLDPLNSFLNFLRKNTPSTETETETEKDRVMKMEMNQFEAIERDRRRNELIQSERKRFQAEERERRMKMEMNQFEAIERDRRRDNLMQSERKRFQAAERKKRKDEVLQSEMNRFQAEERERRMSCKETERERKTNEATERERETDEELEIVISDIDETKEREREMDEELEIEISEIDEAIERERETNKATERERETIKEENFEYIEFEMDSNEDNVEFKMESKEKNEKNKATLQHQEKEGDIYIFELEMEDEKTEQEKTADEKTEQEKTEKKKQNKRKQKTKNKWTSPESNKREKIHTLLALGVFVYDAGFLKLKMFKNFFFWFCLNLFADNLSLSPQKKLKLMFYFGMISQIHVVKI